MGVLGIGNGASFQLVGLRFRARIGVVTGLVGAAGGLGGFLLPIGARRPARQHRRLRRRARRWSAIVALGARSSASRVLRAGRGGAAGTRPKRPVVDARSRPGARTAASAAGSSRRFATGACMPCAAMRRTRSTAACTCRKPLALPEASRSPDRALHAPAAASDATHRFRDATWDDGARRRRAPARDPRRARPEDDRVLHLRPAADRGLLRGQQAGQGLPADQQRRLQLAPVHVVAPSRATTPTFGSDGPPPAYADIELTDCILLLGSNTSACHPILWGRIRAAQERGAKLIVVDPRRTDTAAVADIHLQVRPGTDLALLNALIAGARARRRLDAAKALPTACGVAGRGHHASRAARCSRTGAVDGAVVDGRQPVRRGRRDQPRAAEPVRGHRAASAGPAPARCR